MNAHHRSLYTGTRMRKKRDYLEIGAMPVRDFTSASIVGMTRGARKRLRNRVVWTRSSCEQEQQVIRVAHAAEMSVSEVLGLPEMGMGGEQ